MKTKNNPNKKTIYLSENLDNLTSLLASIFLRLKANSLNGENETAENQDISANKRD